MTGKNPDKASDPRTTIALRVPDRNDPAARKRGIAGLVTGPHLAAARAIIATEGSQGIGAELDMTAMRDALKEQAAAANGGDLRAIEAMLMNQATALQTLFARLVERGMDADLMPHYETHMRLALRAQSQCRATLETLANVKNPPVVIARQANIAQQQQVNNHGPAVPLRAREVSPAQNELLEQGAHERLEFGTQGAASGADSHLETLEKVYRPQD